MTSVEIQLSPVAVSPLSRMLVVLLSALLLCGAALAERSDRDGNDGDNRCSRGKGASPPTSC
jgi:hypothetical protein